MHKLINKVIAVLVVIMMTGMNFLSVSVYAANEISQNAETNEDNVKFNATINDLYETELNISEEATLDLSLSVEESGYLKDIKVFVEDANYLLGEITDEDVKQVDGNELELNEVNKGEELLVKIPIMFDKGDYVSEDSFSKESNVRLQATYVNEKGKEKEIEKTLIEKLTWKTDGEEEISQELIRYIKYDNKTLISFEVKDGIKDNTIPVKSKAISVIVPKINEKTPEKVIVNGENIEYNYENGKIEITSKAEEDKYAWDSESVYDITYIYDTQTDGNILTTEASAKVITLNGEEKESSTKENEFKIENEVGSLVELKANGTEELNKGYMHTSSKRTENKLDTNFEVNYQLNVGYVDVLDKVEVKEVSSNFENENGSVVKNASDSIKTNKISLNRDELISLLGQDGSIIVKDETGKELTTLNQENTEANIDANMISLQTSKPEKEGVMNIKLDKAIKGDSNNSKEEIDSFKKIKTTIQNTGYNGEVEISNTEVGHEIILNEATSKATIDVSTERLSTVIKNEKVIFNIVLNKNDISDALYTNPTVKVKLPEVITGIEVTSGNLLYEDELKPVSSEINNNEIIVKLEGTQTEYNTSTTTEGSLIRLETNLSLNNLAPSSKEIVELEYSNEYTGEQNKYEKEIDVIAPSGFVTTNTIKVDDKEVTAVENDAELIKLKTKQPAKTMEVTANLVNNIDSDAEGFVVLGRIPSVGNKTIGGVELRTNINTTLVSPIELKGLDDATVYYSTNGEETVDGSSWTTEINQDTKSFMITKSGVFENKKGASFTYKLNIPENLDYEMIAKENYGIYYNNDAKEGITRNLVESKVVGITTGSAPDIKAEISAVDTNVGYAIDADGTVTEGEFITYRVKLSNTGSNDANTVKVLAKLPEGLETVKYEQIQGEVGEGYTVDEETKNIEQEVETLKGGETKTFYFDTVVSQKISEVTEKLSDGTTVGIAEDGTIIDESEAKKINISFEISADILEENIIENYTVKNSEGKLSAKLTSDTNGKVELNESYKYILEVFNASYDEKNHVSATIKLPAETKFDSVTPEFETNYDEKNRELTINIGTIDAAKNSKVTINVTNNNNSADKLEASATIKCDGNEEDIKTNTVEINNIVLNKAITANQTSNISGSISDSDRVELYLDIDNTSENNIEMQIEDFIDEDLRVEEYYIEVAGQEVYRSSTSYVNSKITVPAGNKAKLTIIAQPFEIEEGTSADISNQPKITNSNGENIEVNSISLKVNGTKPVEKEEVAEEGNIEESEVKEEEKTYRIAGNVWFDQNKNGQKDVEEARLSGIKLKLYDSNSKECVKDENGNDVQVITDNNGEYAFTKIKEGNYVVVALYNATDYEIANYKAQDVQESSNSDFVETKLDGRKVATTDVIQINGENAYGFDLGLMEKDKFELEVTNYISKITIVNGASGNKEYNYDYDTRKIELSEDETKNSTLLIEYNINVKNNGNVDGYAKSIVNYIPEGMTFSSELNKDWYLSRDGNLYTYSLANTKIKPG